MPRQSRSALLHRRLGDLGTLQAWRARTDRQHRSIGWYATPSAAVDGCSCAFCQHARRGEDVYLGYDSTDAAVAIDRAAEEHEAAVAA